MDDRDILHLHKLSDRYLPYELNMSVSYLTEEWLKALKALKLLKYDLNFCMGFGTTVDL